MAEKASAKFIKNAWGHTKVSVDESLFSALVHPVCLSVRWQLTGGLHNICFGLTPSSSLTLACPQKKICQLKIWYQSILLWRLITIQGYSIWISILYTLQSQYYIFILKIYYSIVLIISSVYMYLTYYHQDIIKTTERSVLHNDLIFQNNIHFLGTLRIFSRIILQSWKFHKDLKSFEIATRFYNIKEL